MSSEKNEALDRRRFISTVGTVGAVGVIGAIAVGCSKTSEKEVLKAEPPQLEPLDFLDQAPDGKPLKAGLIGCGGRGTGAADNFLSAGPNLQITALADLFQDRLDGCRKNLKKNKGVEIPDGNCFTGFDAYKRVIDSGVDVLLIATPPHFRPEHFAASVAARKHAFLEKPVAVDPVGARSIMATARKAEAVELSVVTGTQRRHQRNYLETARRVQEGAIGAITAANCAWNQNQLWFRNRKEGWSDMEYMVRDWVNWCWLSGDHIVEQHVHNIDVVNWFTGKKPVSAVGFGARHRRVTGDQFDSFSIDFDYGDGLRVHSMCRQIDGCTNNVSEFVRGTRGWTNCKDTIWNADGSVAWTYSYPKDKDGKVMNRVKVSPYVQEHVDLVTAIRTNKPINEAENNAVSTLTGIMGRISAYTGKLVTWEEMMGSDFRLGPDEYSLGPVAMKAEVPVPGSVKER